MQYLQSILESSIMVFFTTLASAIAYRIANTKKTNKSKTTRSRKRRKGGT